MSNPFMTSKLETLKEAFPSFEASIISSVLDSVKGNMEAAVEALLNMSNTTHPENNSFYSPPLPSRQHINIPERNPFIPSSNINLRPPSINIRSPNLNIQPPNLNIQSPNINFQHQNLTPRINPPGLNVRQDLAVWRDQLAQESRERRFNRRDRFGHDERSRSCGSSRSQEFKPIRAIAMEGKQAALESASALYSKMVNKYNIESNNSLNILQTKLERVRSSIPSQPISTLRDNAQRSISDTLISLQNQINPTLNSSPIMNPYQSNTANNQHNQYNQYNQYNQHSQYNHSNHLNHLSPNIPTSGNYTSNHGSPSSSSAPSSVSSSANLSHPPAPLPNPFVQNQTTFDPQSAQLVEPPPIYGLHHLDRSIELEEGDKILQRSNSY